MEAFLTRSADETAFDVYLTFLVKKIMLRNFQERKLKFTELREIEFHVFYKLGNPGRIYKKKIFKITSGRAEWFPNADIVLEFDSLSTLSWNLDLRN